MPAPDFQINDTQGSKRPARLTDQHGREWFAEIDRQSGFPAGLVRLRHRTPNDRPVPWVPDQGYLRFSANEPNKVRIDYEAMLSDRLTSHDLYHKQAIRESTARSWPTPVEGGKYDPRIIELIGHPPLPWQPIKAAMDGNSYILGFTDTVDPRLVEYVKKETKVEKLVKGLPDFSDEGVSREDAEDEEDDLADKIEAMRTRGRVRNDKGQFVTEAA